MPLAAKTTVASPIISPTEYDAQSCGNPLGADPSLRTTKYPDGAGVAAVNETFIDVAVTFEKTRFVGWAKGSH